MKKRNEMKIFLKVGIIVFITLGLLMPVSSSLGEIVSRVMNNDEQINQVTMTYTFSKPSVKQIMIGNIVYDRVIMEGSQNIGNPGNPKLPIRSANLLLPPCSKVKNIRIDQGKAIRLQLSHDVEPAGESCPISKPERAKLPIPNEEIYNSKDKFPDKLFTEIGIQGFRGYGILVLQLHPVQYIPGSGELFYYESLTVHVELEINKDDDIHTLFRGSLQDEQQVIKKVDNPEIVNTYRKIDGSNSAMETYDLLIITTEEFKDGFIPLKEAHDDDGLGTMICTVEDITSVSDFWYDGVWGDGGDESVFNDTQCQIRNFIKMAYDTLNIDFVLLGGDNDTVPARLFYYGYYEEGDPPEIIHEFGPSDLYYSCLEYSFNSDVDDRWGESTDGPGGIDDVDLRAEVYVGRACVGSSDEVDNFVMKIISYMNCFGEYLDEVWMFGEYLCGPDDTPPLPLTWGGDYMDELIDVSTSHGYTTEGIPSDEYNIITKYDRNYEWPYEEFRDGIEQYPGIYIINHIGHSYYNYNIKITNYNVSLLGNNDYCFIYSQGCHAGGFDDPDPGIDDCIAEYFTIKTDGAAFAGIWNSRFGWFMPGSTDGDSQRFHREFWDAVFNEDIIVISMANQDSKEENIDIINQGRMRWCYYELNYFGDPTLIIRKHEDDITTVRGAMYSQCDAPYPEPFWEDYHDLSTYYNTDISLDLLGGSSPQILAYDEAEVKTHAQNYYYAGHDLMADLDTWTNFTFNYTLSGSNTKISLVGSSDMYHYAYGELVDAKDGGIRWEISCGTWGYFCDPDDYPPLFEMPGWEAVKFNIPFNVIEPGNLTVELGLLYIEAITDGRHLENPDTGADNTFPRADLSFKVIDELGDQVPNFNYALHAEIDVNGGDMDSDSCSGDKYFLDPGLYRLEVTYNGDTTAPNPGGPGWVGVAATVGGAWMEVDYNDLFNVTLSFGDDLEEQDWWPMFHHDEVHTGYSTSDAPDTNNLLSSYTTSDKVRSSPAIVDDRIYVGSYDGDVYCLNASTMEEIWITSLSDSAIFSSPAVYDGFVYIGSFDDNVYCLDAANGDKLWNFTTGDNVISSPAVVDDKVYIGSWDDYVYCLDADPFDDPDDEGIPDDPGSTYDLIWSYQTGDTVRSSPAVSDGYVYVGSYDSRLYCLDAVTGIEEWNFLIPDDDWVFSSPAVYNGKVYFGSFWGKKIYCLDAENNGAIIWQNTTDQLIMTTPAVAYGNVYIGSHFGSAGNISCFNADTGEFKWSYPTGYWVRSSSPAVADGKVYFGSCDHKVYCLEAETGNPIWNYATNGQIWCSPAIADGKLYIGSDDGKIYAFKDL